MNYILKPSLEHIALVKVAAMLWDLHDVKELMTKYNISFNDIEEKWFMIENVILEKVFQLPLQEQLKKKALCFIRPIGFEILFWIVHYHKDFSFDVLGILHEFRWLPRGAIDTKKTAEVLIKDENIDIGTRYELACTYCLEESIYELWNKMSPERKKHFYDEEKPKVMRNGLVMIWTYDMMKELSKLQDIIQDTAHIIIDHDLDYECSPYLYALEYAAYTGNVVATEHFMHKLEPRERKESLLKAAGSAAKEVYVWVSSCSIEKKLTEVLCVLLSQMDDEQQLKILSRYSFEILKCFLDWPWQIFFMETVNRIWHILPKDAYEILLIKIIGRSRNSHTDFNYKELFRDMWQQSLDAHKTHVFNGVFTVSGSISGLVPTLMRMRDKDNINFIFPEAPSIIKNNFIFSLIGKNICYDLIEENEWSFLEYVIQECLSSKDLALTFRQEFENQFSKILTENGMENKKEKFFRMLDDFIREFS